jgi:hypothetical protein
MARHRRRNAPLTPAQASALREVLAAHSNPKRRRKVSRAKVSRRRRTSGRRVIKRRTRAGTLHPHRIYAAEWARIKTFRAKHAERRKAAAAALSSGKVAQSVADSILGNHYKVNPPGLFTRYLTNAEWLLVKRGRKAADVPVNVGDAILGNHYKVNPRRRNPIVRFKSRGKKLTIKVKSRRKKPTPKHLRKFLFKRGSPKLASALRKARVGYRKWKAAQRAKARKASPKRRKVARRAAPKRRKASPKHRKAARSAPKRRKVARRTSTSKSRKGRR